jgi:hypothetical protein
MSIFHRAGILFQVEKAQGNPCHAPKGSPDGGQFCSSGKHGPGETDSAADAKPENKKARQVRMQGEIDEVLDRLHGPNKEDYLRAKIRRRASAALGPRKDTFDNTYAYFMKAKELMDKYDKRKASAKGKGKEG